LKLYTSKVAPSPKKIEVVIAEKNIDDVQFIDLDLALAEHKTKEYKKIAPNSRVPALVLDDGTVILETTAIARYLDKIYPEPNLFGENPIEIASIELWYSRVTFELMMPLMFGFRHTHPHMANLEKQFPEYGLSQRELAVKSLKKFDSIICDTEYLAGNKYSYADIQMAVSLAFLVPVNRLSLEDYPSLNEYVQYIQARPSFNNR
jgi:glutathione S-transferase